MPALLLPLILSLDIGDIIDAAAAINVDDSLSLSLSFWLSRLVICCPMLPYFTFILGSMARFMFGTESMGQYF